MSGINAVMFYSKSMFEGAGLNGLNALYASCGVGLLNVLVTCLSIWLVDHRLFGRRHLLCFGNIGMCGALTALFTSITLMVNFAFLIYL
jgi:SP family facilitated glucose transporter-like MFS transporter 1